MSINVVSQSGSCDPSTPFYTVDLSADPAATWTSPLDSRDGLCCGSSWPDRCVEFEVTLHPDAVGLSFEISSGAVPPGALFYQIDCGPPIPVGEPICLNDAGPHTLTFCKPGNNPNAYTITSIPAGISSPLDTVKPGCAAELVYGGFGLYEDSITWNDITSGTGYYNSFLDCTSGCDTVNFLAPPDIVDPYVDFQVCGIPDVGVCSGFFGTLCDTFRVYIIPPVDVEITPSPPILCEADTGLTLYALLADPQPGIVYQWFDGPGGTGSSLGFGDSLVVTTAGIVSLIAVDTAWPDCSRDTATENVIITPPIDLTVTPDQDLCYGDAVTLVATGAGTSYSWSPATGLSCTGCASPVADPLVTTTYTVLTTDSYGCTATDSLTVTVNPVYTVPISVEMCDGDSLFIDGGWVTTSGIYNETFLTVDGCDSVLQITLSVLPSSENSVPYSICPGDSVLLPNGIWAAGPGIWPDTLASTGSCFVIVNYEVYLLTSPSSVQYLDICEGDSVLLPAGSWVSTSGTYWDTLAASGGCDSIVQTIVTVLPSYFIEQEFDICAGDSTLVPGGYWVSTAGVYLDTLGSAGGCFQIVETTINIIPRYDILRDLSFCSGDSVYLPDGTWTSTAGTYSSSWISSLGCDSTITTVVQELNPVTIDLVYSICPGDSVLLGSLGWAYWPGTYAEILTAANGCDSLSNHHVSFSAVYSDTIDLSLCSGDSTLLPDGSWISTGSRWVLDTSITGCDSNTLFRVTELPGTFEIFNHTLCEGDSVLLANGYYTSLPGLYTDTLVAANGCDSVIESTVSVNPVARDTVIAVICEGDGWLLPGGTVVSVAGLYADTLSTFLGCDSIIVTSLSVSPVVWDTIEYRLCPGDSVMMPDGLYVSAPFADTYSLTSSSGCDSNLVVLVYPEPDFFIPESVDICLGSSYTLPGGTVVSSSGIYLDSLTAVNGCDSIIETTLSVLPTYLDTQYMQICTGDFYTLPGGSVATTAGFYNDTLTAAGGCDSVIVTDLYVGPILYTTQMDTICDGDSIELHAAYWVSAAGTYIDTLVSGFGCDSIVTTNVVVNTVHSTVLNESICPGDFYWLPDSTFTGTAGSYTFLLTNTLGCDSVVTINLALSPVPADTSTRLLCAGDSLMLPDSSWTSSAGVYDFVLMSSVGCDSLVRVIVTSEPPVISPVSISLCPGDSALLPGGVWAGSAGVYFDTLSTTLGCDSVIRTSITVGSVWTDSSSLIFCPGDSVLLPGGSYASSAGFYSWTSSSPGTCDSVFVTELVEAIPYLRVDSVQLCSNDSVYLIPHGWISSSGTYLNTGTTASGCDSIIQTEVTVRPASVISQSYTICSGDSILLSNGSFTSLPGTWTTVFSSVAGCDSTVTETVSLNPSPVVNIPVTFCEPDSMFLAGVGWVDTSGVYTSNSLTPAGCDSVTRYLVTVEPFWEANITRTICGGDSVMLPDSTFVSSPGIYSSVIPGTGSCPAILHTEVLVSPVLTSGQNIEFCQGDSVLLPGGYWVDSSGTYVDSLVSTSGCDSIVTSVIIVWPSYTVLVNGAICEGDSFPLPTGGWAFNTGFYFDTLSATAGCYAVVQTSLLVYPVDTVISLNAICPGDSIMLPDGSWTGSAGEYDYLHTSRYGCDSVFRFQVEISVIPLDTQSVEICTGDSLLAPDGDWLSFPGDYTFILTSSAGCDSIVVLQLDIVTQVMVTADTVLCEGDSIFLAGSWQTQSGLYLDTLDHSGCPRLLLTDLIIVDQVEMPADTLICPGDSAFLSFEGPGPFVWDPSTGLDCPQCPSTWASPPMTTVYTVTHPICPNSFTTTQVRVEVSNGAWVSAGGDQTVNDDMPLILHADGDGVGDLYFVWSTAGGVLCQDCPSWAVLPDESQYYAVELTDQLGCTDSDTIWVELREVKCEPDGLDIPNAFSPNQDGANDFFRIMLDDPEDFDRVSVYNRWGERIFESEDFAFRWDGTYRGILVDPGVYVYYLTINCPGEGQIVKVGNVTMIR